MNGAHEDESLRRHRQEEIKYRSTPQLAGNADLAAMRFHNRARDGQAHARTLHPVSLVLTPIEFVENQNLLHIVDARSLISDTDLEIDVFQLRCNPDRRT